MTNAFEMEMRNKVEVDEDWADVIVKQTVRIKELSSRLEHLEDIADRLYGYAQMMAYSLDDALSTCREYEAYHRERVRNE